MSIQKIYIDPKRFRKIPLQFTMTQNNPQQPEKSTTIHNDPQWAVFQGYLMGVPGFLRGAFHVIACCSFQNNYFQKNCCSQPLPKTALERIYSRNYPAVLGKVILIWKTEISDLVITDLHHAFLELKPY